MIKNMINMINVINDTVENNKKPEINKEELIRIKIKPEKTSIKNNY